MKLPLKWARVGFVLVLTCLGTLVSLFFAPNFRVMCYILTLALAQAVAGIYIRFKYLRCPHCKQGACPPRWNPDGKFRCQICNNTFYFDDGRPKSGDGNR